MRFSALLCCSPANLNKTHSETNIQAARKKFIPSAVCLFSSYLFATLTHPGLSGLYNDLLNFYCTSPEGCFRNVEEVKNRAVYCTSRTWIVWNICRRGYARGHWPRRLREALQRCRDALRRRPPAHFQLASSSERNGEDIQGWMGPGHGYSKVSDDVVRNRDMHKSIILTSGSPLFLHCR